MRRICSTPWRRFDPQWADYLSPASTILRFQHRFTLAPVLAGPDIADAEILEFVFYRRVDAGWSVMDMLADLPQETTLQRAYEAHLRSGGHWLTRTGARDGSP